MILLKGFLVIPIISLTKNPSRRIINVNFLSKRTRLQLGISECFDRPDFCFCVQKLPTSVSATIQQLYYLLSMFTEEFIFVSYMFQASGLVMLVIGVWMMSQLHKYVDTESPIATTLPIIFLGLSAAILLLAALACCCTAKGKVPLLYLVSLLIQFSAILNQSLVQRRHSTITKMSNQGCTGIRD